MALVQKFLGTSFSMCVCLLSTVQLELGTDSDIDNRALEKGAASMWQDPEQVCCETR